MPNTPNLNGVQIGSEQDINKAAALNALTTILDKAIAGFATVANGDADYTLTSDEASQPLAKFTSTLTAARTYKLPVGAGTGRNRIIAIWNATGGGFKITIKTTAGGSTGIDVTNGFCRLVWHDGTNVYAIGVEVAPTTGLTSAQTFQPQGRLTLVTATPVMTTSQSAKTSIFYTPYRGNLAPIYDGANFLTTVFAELTLALDSNAGHTGYHQSGKNFDLFIVNDAGTIRLVSGPAWTNDTTRATALELKNGLYCNAASMTARFDTSASTLTIAQDKGTYVGTFRASADGQTQYIFGAVAASGTAAFFYLWNAYHRVNVGTMVGDSTDNWTLASSSTRSANNSTAMRVSFVQGVQEDVFEASYECVCTSGAGGGAAIGVGFDSTSAFTGRIGFWNSSTLANNVIGGLVNSALGFHFCQALESSQTAGTASFQGDSGVAYIQNGLIFRGMF